MNSGWNYPTKLETAGKRQTIYNMIQKLHTMKISALIQEAETESICAGELKDILSELKNKGLIYSPKAGEIVCVDL